MQHTEVVAAAREAPEQRWHPLHPQGLVALVRRGLWLASFVAEGAAVLLQALALRVGSVPLVSAVVVAGLPIAVAISAVRHRHRLSHVELAGLLLTTVALCAVALALPGDARPSRSVTGPRALVAFGGCAALVAALVGARPGKGGGRPLRLGAAAGVCSGAGGLLLALCARRIDHPVSLLGSWEPYATVVVGALALVLSQGAFQTERIGLPLAALTVLEPFTATLLAVVVLGEPVASGAEGRAVLAVAAPAAALGLLLLALSQESP
jgi:drug/metabolite transporter (DMT)-like permease